MAALIAGRSSVGVEREPDLVETFDERAREAPALSRQVATDRLEAHRAFVADRRADGDEPGYQAEHYDFPVVTKQERSIRLQVVESVEREGSGGSATDRWVAEHEAVEGPVDSASRTN
jgi:hypothetical protein